MVVKVTKLDILRGCAGDDSKCPVARAIKRISRCSQVFVRRSYTIFGHYMYRNPKKVTKFIDSFDLGALTKPFQFTLK